MNQETGKTRHRFNIVDFFVIIVIIAIVFSIFAREGINTIVSDAKNDTEIEYTLLVENVSENYVKNIAVGDELHLSSTDANLGTITAIDTANYESYVQMGNGELKKSVLPDYYSISIKVKANGSNTDEGFKLGGNYFIAAGASMYVYNEACSFNSLVMSVNESSISDATAE